jgi:hypothetical protein
MKQSKTKKKQSARKPAKSSGGLTKTSRKGQIELDELAKISGGRKAGEKPMDF